jgi:hypothetical protein
MDSNPVLLVGESLNYKSCLVPFLGSGTMLVLERHNVPLLEAGELPCKLIQELLLPCIPLSEGQFSPLPSKCPLSSGFVMERMVGQVILDGATIDYFYWRQLCITTMCIPVVQ